MLMNCYWFMQGKYFHLEKRVAEHLYSAPLQYCTYAFGIYPADQVWVRLAVERQARSGSTNRKSTVPYQTKLYHSVEMGLKISWFPRINTEDETSVSLMAAMAEGRCLTTDSIYVLCLCDSSKLFRDILCYTPHINVSLKDAQRSKNRGMQCY